MTNQDGSEADNYCPECGYDGDGFEWADDDFGIECPHCGSVTTAGDD